MNKWIFLLCVALAGCQASQPDKAKDNLCETIDLSTVLDQKATEIPLGEWAKEVRFVPLETSDSVLLNGYISYLVLFQDKIVIYNTDKIYLFSSEGKFIRTIGSKGEGPGEYVSVRNLSADQEGIHAVDEGKKIHTYGWDGQWLRTANVPANIDIREICLLPDGRRIGYAPNLSGKEPIRMYLFRDSTVLDSIPYAKSFEPGKITMVFYNECQLFSSPSGDYIKEMFNDTIYRVTEKSALVPRWVVDAGKYQLEEGARYQLEDPRNSLFKEKNAAQINIVGYSSGKLYLTANLNGQSRLVVYDEQSGKAESLELPYPKHPFTFKEGNTFIPRFVSDDNRYLIGYEAQENEENPVIILVER